MRTTYRIWIALAAIVLALVLPVGVAGAKEKEPQAIVGGPSQGSARYSAITTEDVLTAKVGQQFWVWRHSIAVGTKLTGVIESEIVAIRDKPFTDGLNRRAVRLVRVFFKLDAEDKVVAAKEKDDEALAGLAVELVDPVGEGEKWAPRDGRILIGQTEQVFFLYKGKLSETLPDKFVRQTDGSVTDLPVGKPVWVSARIVPDSGSYLIAKNEKFSFKEFSDEEGGAALIKKNVRGEILCGTHKVTKGINTFGRQSEDPAIFDREKYVKITHFGEGDITSPFLPDRLRRRPLFRDGFWNISLDWWPDQSKAYISARDLIVIRLKMADALVEVNEYVPWALASDEPFKDEFGDSRGLTVLASAIAQGLYGRTHFQPDPPWTARVVNNHNAIYAKAFGLMEVERGLTAIASK